jgi:Fe-S cluster biogenesis protein NfuA
MCIKWIPACAGMTKINNLMNFMTESKKSNDNNPESKIIQALGEIRPQLQMDGGDVEFVSFDQKSGQVQVRLTGMCAHCPMSQVTLKQGIEEEVKKAVPEVKEVVAV